MSSDLYVKMTGPLVIARVIDDTKQMVSRMLSGTFDIALFASEMEEGQRRYLEVDEVFETETRLRLEAASNKATVGLTIFSMPAFVGEAESGLWCGITVGAYRSPLEYALAASVAVVLGEMMNSKVCDEGHIWIDRQSMMPLEFLKTLQVQEAQDDLIQAADIFYDTLAVWRRYPK